MTLKDVTELNEAHVLRRLHAKRNRQMGSDLARHIAPSRTATSPVVSGLVMTYHLAEWDGITVEWQFYEEDVQRVTIPEDASFRAENIIQRRDTRVKVRWIGWPSKYVSWFPNRPGGIC